MRIFLINAPVGFVGEMSRRGHELMVADSSIGHLQSQVRSENCRFQQLWGRRKINFRAIQQMRRTIKEFEPDLVHAFLPSSLAQAIFGSLGMKKKPKLVSFRGITRIPSWFDPAEWITYLSPRVSMHACESNAVLQAMNRGGIHRDRCTVTYNCIAPIVDGMSRDEARAYFGIPSDAFVVGCVACMRPVKGIDLLLHAASDIMDVPSVRYLLLGEKKDPVVAKLANDERVRDKLIMPGHLDNAPRYMKAFDVFVMPSRREGLCRALLEAMNQGICPIVSDAGGMKEIVRHQTDGLVFPVEDWRSLGQSVQSMYEDPSRRKQYGESAQSRVKEVCSPEKFADRLEAAYQQLCGSRT